MKRSGWARHESEKHAVPRVGPHLHGESHSGGGGGGGGPEHGALPGHGGAARRTGGVRTDGAQQTCALARGHEQRRIRQ